MEGIVLSKGSTHCIVNAVSTVVMRVLIEHHKTVFAHFSHSPQDGLWGTAGQGHLTTIPCPPGYCRCNYTVDTNVMEDNTITSVCSSAFNLSQPDTQCACSRQGYLCGACRSGMSVTAVLNTCTSCDNTWIVGIVMLSKSTHFLLHRVMKPAALLCAGGEAFPCITPAPTLYVH